MPLFTLSLFLLLSSCPLTFPFCVISALLHPLFCGSFSISASRPDFLRRRKKEPSKDIVTRGAPHPLLRLLPRPLQRSAWLPSKHQRSNRSTMLALVAALRGASRLRLLSSSVSAATTQRQITRVTGRNGLSQVTSMVRSIGYPGSMGSCSKRKEKKN